MKVVNGEHAPVLAATGLSAGYGRVPFVRDITLQVAPGEVVALLGANGAGKTTILRALAGELLPLKGQVLWKGAPIALPLHRRARLGLRYVTEERSVFMTLSARDNLRLGGAPIKESLDLFPDLRTRLDVRAGLLSGGEQQMLTLARALAAKPDVLLLDELSLGLAPLIVKRLMTAVREAANGGMAVVLVEQHVHAALQIADRVYVIRRGAITISGTAAEMRERQFDLQNSYLSNTDDGSSPGLPRNSEPS